MIKVFIDESGDLGKGSEYFVLAAAVFPTEAGEKRVRRVIYREQLLLSQSKKSKVEEIKSLWLSFPQRQRILNKIIAQPDIDIYYQVFYKPKIQLLRQKCSKNLIYNYFARLLTDMIFAKYHDDFMVIFDQRATCVKSMNSLPDYITISAYTGFDMANHRVRVEQGDSKLYYNLQTADIFAGTVYRAYARRQAHFLELIKRRTVDLGEFPQMSFPPLLRRGLDGSKVV